MPSNEHIDFMRHALDEGRTGAAAGNPAIGSVIVRGGEIVARGHNTVATTCDPTCHAETVAIRHICQAEQITELPGTTLYTTMEPCPMCMWAICMTKIDRLVMGARIAGLQPLSVNYGGYSVESFLQLTDNKIDVVTGVLVDDCAALRQGS